MREKQLYVIILVLAVALASVSGYLVALAPYSQRGQYAETGQHSGPAAYPVIIGGEEGAQLRTISVAGLGRASAKPDLAELRLGALTQATTATEALTKNADSMNKVIGVLKAIGIPDEDMETSSFNIYPRYSSYGETLIGFEVTHMLRVTTTNLDMVGEIIDRAVEAGANRVEMVYFTFTEVKLQELTELARQEAVEDAKAKAETIAASLGVKIIGVASADETGYYPSPYYYESMMAVPAPSPPTPIMPPTTVEVTVSIGVTFIIE